jgi:CelD/BcsL family acetyltransferase involved in cellulose biosynthesis
MTVDFNGAAQWRLEPITRFDEVADDWDALSRQCGNVPFLRSDFLRPLLVEFGRGTELICICGPAAAPLAMGIFVRNRPGIWQTFQPSQLPLGAMVARIGSGIDTLLQSLIPALPGIAMAASASQQDPSVQARPPHSSTVHTLDYVETARVPITGSFDAYWAGRGKNLRQNVKKQQAKLAQEGVITRLDVVTDPRDVAEAIDQYGLLESAGWKATAGTAVSSNNSQGRFYRSVFEQFSEDSSARIYRYRFGEQVVAMDLCLESAGMLVILKTAYDESFKSLSPASLMRHEYFQSIFEEERFHTIEFFGKVMEWHLRWTSDVRMLYHVNCNRWGWIGKLRVPR